MQKHICFGIHFVYHICWYTNDSPWIRKEKLRRIQNIVRIEIDGRVTLNPKMGLVSTVEDARQRLENIYKNNIKES